MGASFKQWLKISKESSFGVYPTGGTPVQDVDYTWVRLVGDSPFTMRREPARYTVRSADTQNRRAQVGSARYELKGGMSTEFYPSQAGFFLGAALTLTGSYDLNSYSIDYFDSVKTHRYTGCKVAKLSMPSTAQGQDIKLSIDWLGQQDVASPPALAQPAATVFPAATSLPYTHEDSAGLFYLNGSGNVRIAYSDLSVTVTNMLTPTACEQPYPTNIYWCGRDIDMSLSGEYLSTSDRDAYEAVAAQLVGQVKWIKGPSGSPTNSAALTFGTSFIVKVDDKLPLGGAAFQDLSVELYLDRTAGTDVAFAVTP